MRPERVYNSMKDMWRWYLKFQFVLHKVHYSLVGHLRILNSVSTLCCNEMHKRNVKTRSAFLCTELNKKNIPVWFILVIKHLDAQNFCLTISLFHASRCFEHCVLIIRRSKLCYTSSGIITPVVWLSRAQVERGMCTGRPPISVMIRQPEWILSRDKTRPGTRPTKL